MRKDLTPSFPHQKFAEKFILLRDKSALKLGETIHNLSKYPDSHLCLPWCECKKLRHRQAFLKDKISRQQAVITDLQDGIFQPAIDYMNELQTKFQKKLPLTDNLLLIVASSRLTRIVRHRHLADLTRQTASQLSQAQDSAYRRLLSGN